MFDQSANRSNSNSNRDDGEKKEVKERTGDVYHHFPEFAPLNAAQALQNPDSYAVLATAVSSKSDCFNCSFEMQIGSDKWKERVKRINSKHRAIKEEVNVQRKPRPHTTAGGGVVSEQAVASLSNLPGGHPLNASERAFFEPRFDRDLSNVRIHSGGRVDVASRSINARAFTLGNDIAFAGGEYQPNTNEGRRLLAHELTHTIQQANGKMVRRQGGEGKKGLAPTYSFPWQGKTKD